MLEAVGAERSILAICMKKSDSIFVVDEYLDSGDFTNGGNRLIYSLMKELIFEDSEIKLDSYILASHAEEKGIKDFFKLTNNGDLVEALERIQNSVSESSLNKYLAMVKKATIKRRLLTTIEELQADIPSFDGTATDLRGHVEETLLGTMENIDSGDDDMVNLSDNFEEIITEFAEDNSILGLDIKMPRFQRDSGRIRNGTITGIFARAKEGKSQIAAHALKCIGIDGDENLGRLPILYLDTEMQARDQQMRLCSMMTEIKYDIIESGKWRSDKVMLEKVKDSFKRIEGSSIFYKNIAGKSVKAVIPIIRKFIHKEVGGRTEGNAPQCLVIYDYVKLMDPNDLKSAQEYQVLGFLLAALHDLVSKLNFPMIAFGQLNREALRTDSISAIGGSDRITHNVDSLTIFRKKKEEELEADGRMRGSHIMKVLICRKGPAHDYDEWVNLHFDKSCGIFQEDKRQSEINEAILGSRPVADRLEDRDTAEFGSIRE